MSGGPPYTGETRGDLRRVDPALVAQRVGAVLPAFPAVAGAYLFGSALDFVGTASDIDIGLILREDARGAPAGSCELDLAGDVEDRLGRLGPHPFHVTVLRPEENTFTFAVLLRGRLIYAPDLERVTDVIEAVGREHDDLAPFRRTFHRALALGTGG